mmetsp:Transcript_29050/g.66814  ORF Transcript_29050/g.66814 Transcript_29050/m.66814 type:complete len:196 (+) Transcript_29050:61-648(+)
MARIAFGILAGFAAAAALHGLAFVSFPGRREAMAGIAGAVAGVASSESASALSIGPPRENKRPTGKVNDQGFQVMDMKYIDMLQGQNLGNVLELEGNCYNVKSPGKLAKVASDLVVVWDPDGCSGDKSFIQAVGTKSEFLPLLPESGGRHTFHVAAVYNVREYRSKVGQCAETPDDIADELLFQVANVEKGGSCE